MSGNKEISRDTSFDLLRILACFLVVLYHSRYQIYTNGGGVSGFNNLCLNAAFIVGRLAVPMFFIISGYFTFPIKGTTFSFLGKRLKRIIFPLTIWAIIYTAVLSEPSSYLHDIAILSNAPQLWYLYALLGVTLLLPVISPFFSEASRKEYYLYWGIWGITLVFNGNYFECFNMLETNHQGMLFTNPIACLFNFYGYTGYVVLGSYLRKYGIKFSTAMISSGAAVVIFCAAVRYLNVEISDAIGYCTIVNCLISISLIVIVRKLVNTLRFPSNVNNVISDVAKLTFGVYLIHWLVFQLIYNVDYFCSANCIVTSIAVFLLSIIITWCFARLPFSKYIIG